MLANLLSEMFSEVIAAYFYSIEDNAPIESVQYYTVTSTLRVQTLTALDNLTVADDCKRRV